MTPEQAITALDEVFSSGRQPLASAPLVGVFGNGLPPALLPAMGFAAVDVKLSREDEISSSAPDIEPFVEPFVDDYTRIFLHRLFSGKLDDLHAIVFCRDDAAALVAYQYALEFRRQNIGRSPAPRLALWNLVHRTSLPVADFNVRQVEKLVVDLGAAISSDAFAKNLKAVSAAEEKRGEALRKLDDLRKVDRHVISATEAFKWRNAGRFLPAADHADLLMLACGSTTSRPNPEAQRRIALIGSPTDSLDLLTMLQRQGAIVTDLQPFGEVWPGPQGGDRLADILEAEASHPFCPRAEPAVRYRDAIVERCVADRCDVVVSQLDQNDDSVGWDLPSLARALQEKGIQLIDLGFRDHRPDAAWLEAASKKLRAETEVPA